MIVAQSPVKFLIVDDREDNLLVLEALLRREGLQILKAQSGEQALELLLIHDVALALLDVQMPEMDGFTLAELMRGSERSRHIPIIFVTAAHQEQNRVFRGYDAGAVDFLFKPIDPNILWHKANTFFELYRQKQLIEDTLRLNETFVAAVSHDLRNPLNSIVMGTELILGFTDGPARKAAERVHASARRMTNMIEQLYDLARVRLGGGIPLSPKPLEMAKLARNVVAECQLASPDRTILVREEGDTTGEWDPTRIEQVLSNLVGNAIRHGSPLAPVVVTVHGDPETISLDVHNDGVIDAAVKPVLFDPFRGRVDRQPQREGLGLGLFIVKQLCLAHRGSVEVESTPEHGTTFRVRLPRHTEPAHEGVLDVGSHQIDDDTSSQGEGRRVARISG